LDWHQLRRWPRWQTRKLVTWSRSSFRWKPNLLHQDATKPATCFVIFRSVGTQFIECCDGQERFLQGSDNLALIISKHSGILKCPPNRFLRFRSWMFLVKLLKIKSKEVIVNWGICKSNLLLFFLKWWFFF
jgi:hypothetical protein